MVTRDEMTAAIERLKPWFHAVEVAPGLWTKTGSVAGEPADHPLPTWRIIQGALPADLTGKRVLDVGCNGGFYSMEARRRGAEYVLGVDMGRREVAQANFCRRALGYEGMEFRRLSVYDLSPRTVGSFDVTLALGLIYHLKHIMLGLERLYSVTRELLILETAVLTTDQTPASFGRVLGNVQSQLYPLFYVENPPEAAESVYNWFVPSVEATGAMLRGVGFTRVGLFHRVGDRATFVCRKASAGAWDQAEQYFAAHLTLVDGPDTARPGETLTYQLRLQNEGFAAWPNVGTAGTRIGEVRLGAHLISLDEETLDWDLARADLPGAMHPGQVATLPIDVRAPMTPGAYYLDFDMVAEGQAWFEDHGAIPLRQRLEVRSA